MGPSTTILGWALCRFIPTSNDLRRSHFSTPTWRITGVPGVTIKRLITDNGLAYRSKWFAQACQSLGIKHAFTRHYRLQTNGKAERFIQTCLREWAYRRLWANSNERSAWLPAFLAYYNARRPHSALGFQPPASRLAGNKLWQLNT